jgi:hypothetical protein
MFFLSVVFSSTCGDRLLLSLRQLVVSSTVPHLGGPRTSIAKSQSVTRELLVLAASGPIVCPLSSRGLVSFHPSRSCLVMPSPSLPLVRRLLAASVLAPSSRLSCEIFALVLAASGPFVYLLCLSHPLSHFRPAALRWLPATSKSLLSGENKRSLVVLSRVMCRPLVPVW